MTTQQRRTRAAYLNPVLSTDGNQVAVRYQDDCLFFRKKGQHAEKSIGVQQVYELLNGQGVAILNLPDK